MASPICWKKWFAIIVGFRNHNHKLTIFIIRLLINLFRNNLHFGPNATVAAIRFFSIGTVTYHDNFSHSFICNHTRQKGEPICAAHESLDTLNKVRTELGEQVFEAHYQQRPQALDGSFFKPSDFLFYDADLVLWPTPNIIISVDTANKTSFHNDNTVIVVTKVIGDYAESIFYVCEVIVQKFELDQIIEMVKFLSEKYRRQGRVKVVIEDAGIGYTLISSLKKQTNLDNIIDFKPKDSKEVRVFKCLPFFHNKQVRFLKGEKWFERFLNEALSFPKGKHDDQVDALIQAIFYHGLIPKPRIRQL